MRAKRRSHETKMERLDRALAIKAALKPVRKPTVSRYYLESTGSKIKQKDKNFVEQYIKHDGDKKLAATLVGVKSDRAAAYATRTLAKPLVKEQLARMREKSERTTTWELDAKLKKLRQIAEIAVPEQAVCADEVNARLVGHAISAIAEANRMQGHHSAEKVTQVNINVDTDVQQVNELLKQYEKEY